MIDRVGVWGALPVWMSVPGIPVHTGTAVQLDPAVLYCVQLCSGRQVLRCGGTAPERTTSGDETHFFISCSRSIIHSRVTVPVPVQLYLFFLGIRNRNGTTCSKL